MSALEVAGITVILAGAVGYVVCLVLLWRFRMWMGTRGQGWPRLLLGTLLWLMTLLAILYLASLMIALGVLPRPARLVWSFFNGIALAVVPWALAGALWRWWPKGGRLAPRKGGIPNGTGEGK